MSLSANTPNLFRTLPRMFALAALLLIMACGGTEETDDGDNTNTGGNNSSTNGGGNSGGANQPGRTDGAPRWVSDRTWGQERGYIYGVGIGDGDQGASKAESDAQANARQDISAQILVKVESEFDRRVNEVMIDDRSTVTAQSRNRIKSTTDAKLRDTEVVETWTNRYGDVYAWMRAPESIRAEVQRSIDMEWRKDDTLVFASANYEYNQGNYEQTIDLLNTIISRNPGHQQAQLLYGQALAALDRKEDAINRLELVISIKSDSTQAFIASRLARKLREDLGQDVDLDPIEKLLRELAEPGSTGFLRTTDLRRYFSLLAEDLYGKVKESVKDTRGRVLLFNQISELGSRSVVRDFLLPNLESLMARDGNSMIASSSIYAKLKEAGIHDASQADPVEVARSAGASMVITLTGEQLAILRVIRVRDARLMEQPHQFLVPDRSSSAQGGSPIMMLAGIAVKGSQPGWRTVDWGEKLGDAKEARINFRIDRRAFVYALIFSSSTDGKGESRFRILHPAPDGSSLVKANQAFSLPTEAGYQLESGERMERIFVIASQEPIKRLDELLATQNAEGAIPTKLHSDLAEEIVKRYMEARSSIFNLKRIDVDDSSQSSPAAIVGDIVEGFGSVAYYIRFEH